MFELNTQNIMLAVFSVSMQSHFFIIPEGFLSSALLLLLECVSFYI